jgi:hypothetical protein
LYLLYLVARGGVGDVEAVAEDVGAQQVPLPPPLHEAARAVHERHTIMLLRHLAQQLVQLPPISSRRQYEAPRRTRNPVPDSSSLQSAEGLTHVGESETEAVKGRGEGR